MTYRVDDNAGKSIRIQDKVAPSHAVAEPLGDLTFQPVKVWKFMEDHTLKLTKKVGSIP